jgi:hypothetical protein
MPKGIRSEKAIVLSTEQASVALSVLEGVLVITDGVMPLDSKGRLQSVVADLQKQMGPGYGG